MIGELFVVAVSRGLSHSRRTDAIELDETSLKNWVVVAFGPNIASRRADAATAEIRCPPSHLALASGMNDARHSSSFVSPEWALNLDIRPSNRDSKVLKNSKFLA